MSSEFKPACAGTVLDAAALQRAVEMMGAEAGALNTSAGPWSRNAASVLRTVSQLANERAPGFIACSTFGEWFELERLERIADWNRRDVTSRNGCSPFCGKIVHDLLVQLAGGNDPARDPNGKQLLDKQFAAVVTLLAPLAGRMDVEILGIRAASSDEVSADALNEAMASLEAFAGPLDAPVPTRGKRIRAMLQRLRNMGRASGRALRPASLRSTMALLLRITARFLCAQITGIRSELSRSMRPPVHVEILKDFGVSLRRAAHLGGGVTLLPIRNASGNETLGTEVTADGHGRFGVQIYADGAMLPNVRGGGSVGGQRWVRWEIDGLQDAETARHVAGKIQQAMVRSVGGGRRMWPTALAASVVGMAVVGALVAGTRGGPEADQRQNSAQAPASARSNAALAALFDSSASGGGVDEQVMAHILAGAGMQVPVEGETDPWVAQVVAGAAQAAQQANYEAGVPGVPLEDPAMKNFGLGLAPAGCDPSLRFKVAE